MPAIKVPTTYKTPRSVWEYQDGFRHGFEGIESFVAKYGRPAGFKNTTALRKAYEAGYKAGQAAKN